ncbi:thymidylate synthase [Mycoplasmoides pirum]|uniref:thymidylate synthase n=1 Tax=Mycoplasmoides pirum TaxID=2122 RepID=UPI0004827A53|nr:thymidylate synthase [Mycoplasmoides pirum]
MKQYLDTLKYVLKNGIMTDNRTKIRTLSTFGLRMEFDLLKGFPLITTKKVFFPGIVHELLWFISGNTNIQYLVKNNVNIWNEWPYEKYKQSKQYKKDHDLLWFKEKIIKDDAFAKKWGNLGPVYGKQWRNFLGVDQLKKIISEIKNNPTSRRLIISAWNPKEIEKMALPPCHSLFQFKVLDNKLHCQLYQRSADLFLGVPFNIASYSLLTMMLAHVTNLKCGKFIHILGDAHIYENHLDQVKLQITRKPKKLPKIILNSKVKDLFKFKYEDIELVDYESWPKISGVVAV